MKIIALGDIHGRTNWKTITAKNDFDKVIFIGDYFDTHESISPTQQKDNFRDLITYKKANMDKVILLLGNHDYHYLRTTNEHYSGYQEWQKTDIQEMLYKAIDAELLKMCHLENNVFFVHAGVTKTWCDRNFTFYYNFELPDLTEAINDKFKYQPNAFRFTSGTNHSNTGDDVTQSPIWVRPNSLFLDGLANCIQVVGHTVVNKIELTRKILMNGKPLIREDVILIDTLGTSGEYLQIIDDVISVAK